MANYELLLGIVVMYLLIAVDLASRLYRAEPKPRPWKSVGILAGALGLLWPCFLVAWAIRKILGR